MEDYLIDPENFDVNKIKFIKPKYFLKFTYSLGIFYGKKKIILRTPKMRVENIDKYITLSFLPLASVWNEMDINQFYKFITNIDKICKDTIDDNFEKGPLFKKSIFNSNIAISLPTDPEYGPLYIIYDDSGKKSNISCIRSKSIVSCIIELSEIKFGNDIRCVWNLLEIRKHKPFSPCYELIQESNIVSNNIVSNIIKPPPPPKMSPKIESTKPYHHIPTTDELLGAMKRLNKIN